MSRVPGGSVETMLVITGGASAAGAVLALVAAIALWVRRAVSGR